MAHNTIITVFGMVNDIGQPISSLNKT